MRNIGPALVCLQRRIAEAPDTILDHLNTRVPTLALVHDVVSQHHPALVANDLIPFSGAPAQHGWHDMTRLLCWLITDPAFETCTLAPDAVITLLHDVAKEVHQHGTASAFRQDPDRREELVRLALAALDLRPEGETVQQAQDRLNAVSVAERQRVLAAARAAEQRARKVREALAKKKAQEAADKWTRE